MAIHSSNNTDKKRRFSDLEKPVNNLNIPPARTVCIRTCFHKFPGDGQSESTVEPPLGIY